MKVTLYMAVSADGYIARNDDSTPWSDEEWRAFITEVHSAGNMIIGRRTYENVISDSRDFREYGDATVIVVSEKVTDGVLPGITFVSSPEEAVRFLEAKGSTKALVAGGAILNASFLKAGILDALIVDVEPKLFGSGLRLFAGDVPECNLHLDEVRKLSEQSIQLRYTIVK